MLCAGGRDRLTCRQLDCGFHAQDAQDASTPEGDISTLHKKGTFQLCAEIGNRSTLPSGPGSNPIGRVERQPLEPYHAPVPRPSLRARAGEATAESLREPPKASMTSLPATTAKKLGLVIDLDTCVGCQACATSCKEWNAGGYSAPLSDQDPYGADPHGTWLNRVHSYEVGDGASGRTVHFPRSCLHCETPACVTVCPTGASYKRAEDGIVLVDPDTCIGCKLCSWACPYGAREYDYADGVMKKCTLCVDRIYNETFAPEDRVPACVRACPTGARHFGDLGDEASAVSQLVRERGGYDLMPEIGFKPVNKYLPPRPGRTAGEPRSAAAAPSSDRPGSLTDTFFAWADKLLSR